MLPRSSTAVATAGWSGSTSATPTTGEVTRRNAEGLFLLLGAEPHVRVAARRRWPRDERGFVLTGRDVPKERWGDGCRPATLETTVPGIFAAGDIRGGSMKRVAAASGEGASVVPLVHAWLARTRTAGPDLAGLEDLVLGDLHRHQVAERLGQDDGVVALRAAGSRRAG